MKYNFDAVINRNGTNSIKYDFTWNGHTHTCFGLLNENAVIATAPSKTFNLAGLQVSNVFIKNENLRNKLKAELNRRVENAKLWLNDGTMFGAGGKGFQRINIACPKSILIDALEKLGKEFIS